MYDKNRKYTRRGVLVSLYRPYAGWLVAVLACALLCTAISLALPLLMREITSSLEQGGIEFDRLVIIALTMLGLILVWAGSSYFYDAMGHVMGARMENDMRRSLFDKFLSLPLKYHDGENTGRLMSRLSGDTLSMAELFHHGPEDVVIFTLEFVGALTILFMTNASLTLAVIAMLPFVIAFSLVFRRKLYASYKNNREIIADVNARVEDTMSGIRVVKSFGNEALERNKFARENERFLAGRSDIYKKESIYSVGMEAFFSKLVTVLVVVFGGWLISRASISISDLILFIMYVGYLTAPIKGLSNTMRLYQEGMTGLARYVEVMELPDENYGANSLPEPFAPRGDICYENVSFTYDEGTAPVLDEVDLTIKAGECIALTGPSGVGKTTLCALLPRLYDGYTGRITIDGTDILDIPLSALRSKIGIVQQDVYLFDGTILENIRYGLPSATRSDVERAARLAGASEFISALPDGYDTQVAQRGVRLSGGQKQRVSIARIFLLDPPILIFDEATSALDRENEDVILNSLDVLARNRTTLIVAHRHSTIRNADRVVVMEEGRVREGERHFSSL